MALRDPVRRTTLLPMPAPEKKAAKFQAHSGEPMTLDIVTQDGKEFAARVAVTVLGVTEVVGVRNPTGVQQFEIRATVAFDVTPKGVE